MSRLVVDASVLAKLYFLEQHSDKAERVLLGSGRGRGVELIAPDLLWAEFGNIVWKRHRRGDVTAERAKEAVREAVSMPIRTVAAADYAGAALDLAIETGRTVYDCLYLAVAIAERGVMVTADEKLVNGLKAGVFGRWVRWVGEGA